MRYFLDTEFNEDGHAIELISIAVVAEDGREFYAVSADFEPKKCNPWVVDNVLPKLPDRWTWRTRAAIREDLLAFVDAGGSKPEFWAYYADYDWVALCQLFGRMIDLPKGWPMWCRDLKQLMQERHVEKDAPGMPPQENLHDALADARWVRDAWKVVDGSGIYISVAELEERLSRSKQRQLEEERDGYEGEALVFQGYIEELESLLSRAKDERLREFRRR